MELRITVSMENAAFEDDRNDEIVRILRRLAMNIQEDAELTAGYAVPLRDVNGNLCGIAKIVGKVAKPYRPGSDWAPSPGERFIRG